MSSKSKTMIWRANFKKYKTNSTLTRYTLIQVVKKESSNILALKIAGSDQKIKKWLQDQVWRFPEKGHRTRKYQLNSWIGNKSSKLHVELVWTESGKNYGIIGPPSVRTVRKQRVESGTSCQTQEPAEINGGLVDGSAYQASEAQRLIRA